VRQAQLHRAPGLRITACSRDAPEPPSTANDRHQQQPVNLKLARALNPASNARDTLVMRSSASTGSAIGSSTAPCTSSLSAACAATRPPWPTSSAAAPKAKPTGRSAAASSATSPATSTANTRDFRCLGLSGVYRLSCSLSVLESVFVAALPVCGHGRGPRVAAGLARGSTVRVPGGRGGSSFLACCVRGGQLAVAGGEDGDLGFPGDGRLGAGGVREFRACFLRAFRVALPARDVEGVQARAGGGVRRGGERVQ